MFFKNKEREEALEGEENPIQQLTPEELAQVVGGDDGIILSLTHVPD